MILNENQSPKEQKTIRHHFDDKSGEIYFSIVDIIENLGLSKDSRNYWKVLKNRLKKADNQLVTNCNQLKILAKDGKYYQTDVANAQTILKIIQIIYPEKVKIFSEYFDKLEEKNSPKKEEVKIENNELSTPEIYANEIQIDMHLTDNYLTIKSIIAGINPEDIFINIGYDKLTIRGNKIKVNDPEDNNYFTQELIWGKFLRVISLPKEIDIDRAEATFYHGLLTIKLFLLNKDRNKIIKINNIN